MAIAYATYVVGDRTQNDSTGRISFSGRSAGELAIVLIQRYDATYGNQAISTAPSNWNLLQSDLSTTGYGNWVYYKILESGDIGNCDWTWANNAKINMTALIYTGVSSSTPIPQSNDSFASGGGSTFATGGITTSKTWVVGVCGGYNTSGRTFAAESGWTLRNSGSYGNTTCDIWQGLYDTNDGWGGGSCSPTFDEGNGYSVYGRYGCVLDLAPGATTYYGATSLSASASIGSGTPAKVPASHKAIVATNRSVTVTTTTAATQKASGQVHPDAASSVGVSAHYRYTAAVVSTVAVSISGTQAAHKAKGATALNVSVSVSVAAKTMTITAASAPHVHISMNLPCSVQHWGAGSMSAAGALAAIVHHTAKVATSHNISASCHLDTLDEIYIERKKDADAYSRLTQEAWSESPYTDTGPFDGGSTYYYKARRFHPNTGWSSYSNEDSVVYPTVLAGAVALAITASIAAAASPMHKTAATAPHVHISISGTQASHKAKVAIACSASCTVVLAAEVSGKIAGVVALSISASTGLAASHKASAALSYSITATISAAGTVPGGEIYAAVGISASATVATAGKQLASGLLSRSISVSATFNTLDTISIERKVGAGSWVAKHTGLWSAGLWIDSDGLVYGTTYVYRARRHGALSGWSSYSNEDSVYYGAQLAVSSFNVASTVQAAASIVAGTHKTATVAISARASVAPHAHHKAYSAIALNGAVQLTVGGGLISGVYGFGLLRFIGVETALKLMAVSLDVSADLDAAASPRTTAAALSIGIAASLNPTSGRRWYGATSISVGSSVTASSSPMIKRAGLLGEIQVYAEASASHNAPAAVTSNVSATLTIGIVSISWSAATTLGIVVTIRAHVTTSHSAAVTLNIAAEATVQRIVVRSASLSLSVGVSFASAGYVVPITITMAIIASMAAAPTLYTLAITEIDVLTMLVAAPMYIPITGGPNLPVRIAAPQWPYQHRRRHNAPVKRHRVVIH